MRAALQGSRSKSGQVFTIGVVGRCLSKALVEGKRLEGKCRDLVRAELRRDPALRKKAWVTHAS